MSADRCRSCEAELRLPLCDLGMSPLSNANVTIEDLARGEMFFPLCPMVCESCWLVQLPQVERPDRIFSDDYAYFSSYSDSWLAHSRAYCEQMCRRLALGPRSQVVEIASNDGYLLQYFKASGIPVLGIEPAANCAEVAQAKGIETRTEFFGRDTASRLAAEGLQADLLLGNNVLAHVPDINDFVAGLKIALKSSGVVTMEFPHLLQLIRHGQFDTIYHEHYSYLSLMAVSEIFARHGLSIFDVEELTTHGGSLRIFARHAEDGSHVEANVANFQSVERRAGLDRASTYQDFGRHVQESKRKLLTFLIRAKEEGRRVWGYGAPAKGNTLLNYCGIRSDLVEATVDRSPHKQGRFLPGSRIPIYAPDRLVDARPDFVLILPWNLRDEIVEKMSIVRSWGGRFLIPVPEVTVLP
jgi:2-polyprenyl-3-methyl-5-hydroxy-6-metoxy-1,4-benzoquinol methylase